ncbi:MAG: outer membrane beta-barrel protein [Acidobacteriota bacterium]|nr:outer membrane beta-barrel protein [Acidobacteriota bacterium]
MKVLRFVCAVVPACLLSLGVFSVHAQTSVGVSAYGAFSGSTSGNGTVQSPSNSAGGLIELRHISNPLVGFEATYSFNRANQSYTFCNPSCTVAAVKANAHEVTADWVVSAHIANLRPFALAGIGMLFNQPVNGGSGTTSDTTPVYVYGAGLDLGLLPHLGLRFQYRGNLYKAPHLVSLYTSTDRFTQTAEPMIGAYFNF